MNKKNINISLLEGLRDEVFNLLKFAKETEVSDYDEGILYGQYILLGKLIRFLKDK